MGGSFLPESRCFTCIEPSDGHGCAEITLTWVHLPIFLGRFQGVANSLLCRPNVQRRPCRSTVIARALLPRVLSREKRQRALRGQLVDQRRVVRFDELVEKSLLGLMPCVGNVARADPFVRGILSNVYGRSYAFCDVCSDFTRRTAPAERRHKVCHSMTGQG